MFSDIRITPVTNQGRLKAFVVVVIDRRWIVKDMKIIEKATGELFVSMPNKMCSANCAACKSKNPIRARYCNFCGGKLEPVESIDVDGTSQVYLDIMHPLNNETRLACNRLIIDEYYRAINGGAVMTVEEGDHAALERKKQRQASGHRSALVITRRSGDFVWINDDIKITIGKAGGKVDLIIEASRKYRILRGPELVSEDGVPNSEQDGCKPSE